MSTDGREDLERRVGELAETLEALERELEARGRRPPARERLVRFTREVTIPAAILLLRTNIEALRLLRRALAFADEDRDGGARTRRPIEELGETALEGLESALSDLGDALAGRPEEGEARDLLAEARELRREIEADLERDAGGGTRAGAGTGTGLGGEAVDIDVESELESIRDEVDGDGSDQSTGSNR